ncbi:dCTP deaminase domain-containing protein [Pseudomonas viridiflava]|uniref:dCTP deaminase n=1 Tax=Pseudomonas viridiflava TaxID=33069 RepID=UPI002EBA840B|nr:deoxycytidine deaminase [Pseudomonas viridiflava]
MIVIDKNLEHLAIQYSICDKSLFDEFSLKIQLSRHYYEPQRDPAQEIVYMAHPGPATLFSERKEIAQNLVLLPGEQVITCSSHHYKIPLDYFGLVQTKGTLARLFVQVTCNDGQVEPGFEGFITLEIVNLSPWTIKIPAGADIAQMYLLKCSSTASEPYHGRYAEEAKKGPTLAVFGK